MELQPVLQEVFFEIQAARGLALEQDQREARNLLERVDMVEVAVIVRPGHEDRVRGEAGIYLE